MFDLREGCEEGTYEEIPKAYAMKARSRGCMVSSAFTVWQDRTE